MKQVFSVLLLAAVLSGCALFESKATRALHNSPDYRAGYSDGCASADASNADRRDDSSYSANRAYKAGYGAGLGACRPRTPGNGIAGGGLGQNAIPPTGP